ncbi:unnamed protein product [Ambrosiozyma monospora]|uniref:Unnamed protein product n=1 Tax=Ambrosiozyma monospora TaxID=43982 RepID=A0A9W6YZN2_AMBMO|nr:unnamed protein product [Ambrosiozyma monospora]
MKFVEFVSDSHMKRFCSRRGHARVVQTTDIRVHDFAYLLRDYLGLNGYDPQILIPRHLNFLINCLETIQQNHHLTTS